MERLIAVCSIFLALLAIFMYEKENSYKAMTALNVEIFLKFPISLERKS